MTSLKRYTAVLAIAAAVAPSFAAAEDTQTVPASCLTALMASLPQQYAAVPHLREIRSNGYSPLEFLDLSGPTTEWMLTATNPRNSHTVARLTCTVLTTTGQVLDVRKDPAL